MQVRRTGRGEDVSPLAAVRAEEEVHGPGVAMRRPRLLPEHGGRSVRRISRVDVGVQEEVEAAVFGHVMEPVREQGEGGQAERNELYAEGKGGNDGDRPSEAASDGAGATDR